MRRPKRGKKAQQAAAAAAGDDGSALDSIPEAEGAAPASRVNAVKPAVSDDDTLGGGLSLMDRLAGPCGHASSAHALSSACGQLLSIDQGKCEQVHLAHCCWCAISV